MMPPISRKWGGKTVCRDSLSCTPATRTGLGFLRNLSPAERFRTPASGGVSFEGRGRLGGTHCRRRHTPGSTPGGANTGTEERFGARRSV